MTTLKEKATWIQNCELFIDCWGYVVTLEDAEQEMKKIKQWIFGLYKTADHLSHEDERQSCAYFLKDFFGVETEEGTFGELFLTEKAVKELEEIK